MGVRQGGEKTGHDQGRLYRDKTFEQKPCGDKIEFGEETYDAVWLLSQFIQMSLQPFPEIEGIVFTVPALTEELAQMLRGSRCV